MESIVSTGIYEQFINSDLTGQCKLGAIHVFYWDEENTFNGYAFH